MLGNRSLQFSKNRCVRERERELSSDLRGICRVFFVLHFETAFQKIAEKLLLQISSLLIIE